MVYDLYNYSSVLNCRGGNFPFFRFFYPQNQFIMTPHLMTFLPKKAKTFNFLRVFSKIKPIALYYGPPILWISLPLLIRTPPTIKHGRIKVSHEKHLIYNSNHEDERFCKQVAEELLIRKNHQRTYKDNIQDTFQA